jgi:hypothetical protein
VALATKWTGEPEVEPFVGDETVMEAKADALNATSTQNIAKRTEGVRRAIRYLLSQTTVAVRVRAINCSRCPRAQHRNCCGDYE